MLSQDNNVLPNFKSFLKKRIWNQFTVLRNWYLRRSLWGILLLKAKRFEKIHSQKTDTREILPNTFSYYEKTISCSESQAINYANDNRQPSRVFTASDSQSGGLGSNVICNLAGLVLGSRLKFKSLGTPVKGQPRLNPAGASWGFNLFTVVIKYLISCL